jgi:hypothetical protein
VKFAPVASSFSTIAMIGVTPMPPAINKCRRVLSTSAKLLRGLEMVIEVVPVV